MTKVLDFDLNNLSSKSLAKVYDQYQNGTGGHLKDPAKAKEIVQRFWFKKKQKECMDLYNDNVELDYTKALEYLEKAAGYGNAEAQYMMGDRLLADAIYWLQRASIQGNRDALFRYSILSRINLYKTFKIGDPKETMINLAKENMAEAASYLATEVLHEAEECEAFIRELITAKAYDSFITFIAEKELGSEYRELIIDCMKIIADSGQRGKANTQLGIFYLREYFNYSNTNDLEKALEVIRFSAEIGDAEANFIMFDEFYIGDNYFVLDEGQAVKCLESAAEKGYPKAINAMGILSYKGQFVPKDIQTAQLYFEKAASMDSMEAYYNLGRMAENNSESLDARYYYLKGSDINYYCAEKYLSYAEKDQFFADDDLKCTREEIKNMKKCDSDTFKYYYIQ